MHKSSFKNQRFILFRRPFPVSKEQGNGTTIQSKWLTFYVLVAVLLLSTINITEVVICKKKNHIVKLMGNIHVSPVSVSSHSSHMVWECVCDDGMEWTDIFICGHANIVFSYQITIWLWEPQTDGAKSGYCHISYNI